VLLRTECFKKILLSVQQTQSVQRKSELFYYSLL